jgi:hypothetical protein
MKMRALLVTTALLTVSSGALLGTPSAQASDATYCKKLKKLGEANQLSVLIVPTDSVSEAVGKMSRFRAAMSSLLPLAPGDLKPEISVVIKRAGLAKVDLAGIQQRSAKADFYKKKLGVDLAVLSENFLVVEADAKTRCDLDFVSDSIPLSFEK